MPTPLQLRERNINRLFEALKGENMPTVTDIYNKTIEFFPTITEKRAENYVQTVLRMLKTKKKEEK